ncbi:hypothetical protein BCR41DRAFT_359315 [Lobosporangium transversale]|uniref:CBM1 domain-containing protein n=1 Tax=Lobosporangium transversale TaxID=64571 RepID=A0A1Y2GFH2_9FUNG|nr:hypothetical protein BCR41DRAFT_359315 [Lobosporangium transversale]ORZ08504.1 hypothetical protein BCR41DRAFT_359315 [Lobosporangium transversale]|eukprot:XP_021878432.1 hypothetical protein BCR41DRAFT_359315 [Lobosporangium transversale]
MKFTAVVLLAAVMSSMVVEANWCQCIDLPTSSLCGTPSTRNPGRNIGTMVQNFLGIWYCDVGSDNSEWYSRCYVGGVCY